MRKCLKMSSPSAVFRVMPSTFGNSREAWSRNTRFFFEPDAALTPSRPYCQSAGFDNWSGLRMALMLPQINPNDLPSLKAADEGIALPT